MKFTIVVSSIKFCSRVEWVQMVKIQIPPKENEQQQLIASVVVLIIVAVVVAILSKLLVGLVIFLLGAVFSIGSQVVTNSPLDKDK